MLLKKFYINVMIRVIFIALSCVLLGIATHNFDYGYFYTLAGFIFLIAIQTILLVNKVNKTNDDLEKFFSSVYDHNTSMRFTDSASNSSFEKLHDSLNRLNTIIQKAKIENERTNHFLKSVVNHFDIGLIAFDENGKIELYNRAAKRYLIAQQLHQLSSLEALNDEIFYIINTIRPGQELLYKMKIANLLQSILIKASELKFENNVIKLVSFQDITNELDKKELDSWQRLIRVLTHEIMNSISPITSLTSVISGYFKNKDNENPIMPDKINQTIISKTLSGLNTIEETGKGLLEFVDKYRSFTSLPKPAMSKFAVGGLFQNCKLLMESIIPNNIQIFTHVYPQNLELFADYAQVEQILINLIKNAIEALNNIEKGTIELHAFNSNEGVTIQIEDNGVGISNDIIDDIFVPFYTTKANGSGIGLSLSKQIMQNHNGNISVNSTTNEGSTFTLKFQ